jgi:hypothetical protein
VKVNGDEGQRKRTMKGKEDDKELEWLTVGGADMWVVGWRRAAVTEIEV